jgi:hypothetical protein
MRLVADRFKVRHAQERFELVYLRRQELHERLNIPDEFFMRDVSFEIAQDAFIENVHHCHS